MSVINVSTDTLAEDGRWLLKKYLMKSTRIMGRRHKGQMKDNVVAVAAMWLMMLAKFVNQENPKTFSLMLDEWNKGEI